MRKVGVIFGGRSCENEISVLTGVFVARLLQEKYDVLPIYLHTDGKAYTSKSMTELDTFKALNLQKCTRLILEDGKAYAFLPTKGKLRLIGKRGDKLLPRRIWRRGRGVGLDGTKRRAVRVPEFDFVGRIYG